MVIISLMVVLAVFFIAIASSVFPTRAPAAAPASAQTAPPSSANDPPLTSEVVAVVNGHAVQRQTLQTLLAADRALAKLFGQTTPSNDDPLERLVNGELVAQAAAEARFTLNESQVNTSLNELLRARGKSSTELDAALSANAVSRADFQVYFARLLLIDRFTRAQAQAQNLSVAAYITRLQQKARISFGPAAELALVASTTSTTPTTPTTSTAPTNSGNFANYQPLPLPGAPTTAPAPANVTRGTDNGQFAPLFDLPAVNGQTNSLSLTRLTGKPTLLNFFTTWCPYCARQTPLLVAAAARYAPQGAQFVGIDVKEGQDLALSYIANYQIPYVVGLDTTGEVAGRYGIRGFPTTFFLDAQGRIVARHIGQLSAEQIDGYVRQILPAP
jgi:thiol-disulfide isomerase/thioredoxin